MRRFWTGFCGVALGVLGMASSHVGADEYYSKVLSRTMETPAVAPLPASASIVSGSAGESPGFSRLDTRQAGSNGLRAASVYDTSGDATVLEKGQSLVRQLRGDVTVAPTETEVPRKLQESTYEESSALWNDASEKDSFANDAVDSFVMPTSAVQPVQITSPLVESPLTESATSSVSAIPSVRNAASVQPASCGLSCGSACGPTCGGGCGNCCQSSMQCTSACCNDGRCDGLCGCSCCRSPFWARVDLLLWFMDGYKTPPLVTQSPAGTPANIAGVLGNDSTTVVAGNTDVGDGLRLGGRVQTGYWFDPCRKFGIQGEFFALGDGDDGGLPSFQGDGTNTYARPFFNTDPNVNAQDAQIFSRPGLGNGSVRFGTSSNVYSGAPTFRRNLCCCEDRCNNRSRRTDFLCGYRFFHVRERFSAREILFPEGNQFVPGTRYELNDRIETKNQFHGIELGLNHMNQSGRWLWDLETLVALGQVRRTVDLNGSTRLSVPGFQDDTLAGGFYVPATKIGQIKDNDFGVIPQVRATVSYCLGSNWRLGAGYNFLYLNSMFRPDSYINPNIDGSQMGRELPVGVVGERIATPKRDMFLHGVNIRLSYNF